MVVDGTPAARDAAVDALRLAIGTAFAADRTLIEKIVAVSVPTKGKRMSLDLTLCGDLAGILALSLNADRLSGQQKASFLQYVMEKKNFWLRRRDLQTVSQFPKRSCRPAP